MGSTPTPVPQDFKFKIKVMTEQEIREHINREYPPGTKFKPVGPHAREEIITVKKTWTVYIDEDEDAAWFQNKAGDNTHTGFICHPGKWATIVGDDLKEALIPVTKYVQGLRVQRGPDWSLGNQNGGPGRLGTVIDENGAKGWVSVKWDFNKTTRCYQVGHDDKYDLALADPADAHLLQDKPVEEFHNPDKLTQDQVGEGYRLFYPSEVKDRTQGYKSINCWITRNKMWNDMGYGETPEYSFRVPACFPKDFTEDYIRDYEAGTPVRATTLHEDLIEEAKRRYPVGTEYRCATGGSEIYTVSEQRFTIKIWSDDVLQVYGEHNKGCLYHNYRWADIVSQAKPKFKIGDKVIGNDKASKLYNITGKGYISEVVSINEDNSILKLTSGFYVSTECFDLYTEEKTEEKTEEELELPTYGHIVKNHQYYDKVLESIKKSRGYRYSDQAEEQYLLWNSKQYWWDSSKPWDCIYKKVNKLITINNSENEKHTENRSGEQGRINTSAVLQSIDFKIGQGSASRGVGLKGSVSEIRLGNHSGNYQKRLSHS